MAVCTFRVLVVLHRMLALSTWYEMIKVWDTVSTFTHLPRSVCLFEKTIGQLFEKTIGQVAMNLIYIKSAYYSKDNLQAGCTVFQA